jgi:hypothetical protein
VEGITKKHSDKKSKLMELLWTTWRHWIRAHTPPRFLGGKKNLWRVANRPPLSSL